MSALLLPGGLAGVWGLAAARGGVFQLLSVKETVFVIAFLVISLGLHEAAHAWVAYKRGDSTARDLGRLTLNPLAHIDPFMTVILPAVLALTSGFIFGGARPVPVNPTRLKSPIRDMMLVAIAGPLMNLFLAVVFMAIANALIAGPYRPDQLLPRVMYFSAMFNVVLAVFNMLPIPPLDGSRVMTWLLPPPLRASYVSLERYGMILVIVFVFMIPGVQTAMGHAIFGILDALEGATRFS